MAYSTIDLGSAVSDRSNGGTAGYSYLLSGNVANATGVLTTFQFWFQSDAADPTGIKAGTFSGSGTSYTRRDQETIGNVTKGSAQTFTGKNCDVVSGDLLGIYTPTGDIEWSISGGGGAFNYNGDSFGGGAITFTALSARDGSFYAEGVTLCDAPTNVAATENDGSKVTITWTKSTGATGYYVLRDGIDLVLLGDVATYDDTTAAAPIITAGTASASDGAYSDKVNFSLSGNSIANGTEYTYTVKAVNAAGISGASSGDTGYRKAQTVSLQWQKSNGDASFASFSDIAGATSVSGDDTDIAAEGLESGYAFRYYRMKISATGFDDVYSVVDRGCRDAGGRYYRCALSAPGSTTVYSTADRGYRATTATSFIQEIMRVHYVPSLGGF